MTSSSWTKTTANSSTSASSSTTTTTTASHCQSQTTDTTTTSSNKQQQQQQNNIWQLRQAQLTKTYQQPESTTTTTSDWPIPNQETNQNNSFDHQKPSKHNTSNKKINWKPIPTQITLNTPPPHRANRKENHSRPNNKKSSSKHSYSPNKSNRANSIQQSESTERSSDPLEHQDPSQPEDQLPSNPKTGFIPRISPTIKPPIMELSAGPTNSYIPGATTNYPIPQSNSSTPLAPLPLFGSSIPLLPTDTTQQQFPPPTLESAPLDLHVNAPQGNVWVNHPLVMSDGTAPVSSTSEDHTRSAAMVLDASSLDTLQPPTSHPLLCPIDPSQPISSKNSNPTPEELPLEKLNLGSKSPTTKQASLSENTQSNSYFRRTSHNLPNRSPRKFKDHDSNHIEGRHVSAKFGSPDHKFNSASSPISSGNTHHTSLAYSNESPGTTVGSRDHSHRKYSSSSHPSSQQNSHNKGFHSSGRLSNGINKNYTSGRHGGWKNNNNSNNLHHSSGPNMKTRALNSTHSDRHPSSHHLSRAPRISLRSNEEYSSNWYPPVPSLDGNYPTGLGYSRYSGMEYAQPPNHPYGGSNFYPSPTYRMDSTNPDSTNLGVTPSSGATGPTGHHHNQPPRFHVPSSSPTTTPYGSNPLTVYSPTAPPDSMSAYPPSSEHYYGIQNYYPSQYNYPPPIQQQQPPITMPFSPNGQPDIMFNMLSPSSVTSYGENYNDSSCNTGYLQHQQQTYYPTYPTYPAPVTQLSYPLDSVRYYILGQCEYYFSSDNLVKDMFLRNCMDREGWVSISMIGRFNRIKSLTDDEKLVIEVMKMSGFLEVDDQKMAVRRRGDWDQWILSATNQDNIQVVNNETLVDLHQQQRGTIDGSKPESMSIEGNGISSSTPGQVSSEENINVPQVLPPDNDLSVGSEKDSLVAVDHIITSSAVDKEILSSSLDHSLVIVTPGISKNSEKIGNNQKNNLQPTISIGFDPNQIKKNSNNKKKQTKSRTYLEQKTDSNNNGSSAGEYLSSNTNNNTSNGTTVASASDMCSVHSSSDLK